MSPSPPPTNVLLNPLPELISALASNAFGIRPGPDSGVVEEATWPRTEEDVKLIRARLGRNGLLEEKDGEEKVRGKVKVGLIGGEGDLVVVLDQRGWTIESAQGPASTTSKIGTTYESLETLLIATSKSYAEAMNQEIWKRFEGFTGREDHEEHAE
ncbi:hypothetical protein L202_02201 [Cryptococcus amylolentus CBS 6039]|uniref:GSKIP domain-containing protein n=2 Tax=Cryptococcus amylolentus TaxID=104669 RepID=A0A1E3I000_9TREE|nr:hypothetical protein L202_02201 [Cryptococcus amylolentus CBS 6039]ODN81838.1 hypothetical protein L202_02201 [Cryptococcus amylolentus CBS 6039]ODO09992.1 hypothetical protein I350_02216 [Cryptococcus amylolentus CBS 6273]